MKSVIKLNEMNESAPESSMIGVFLITGLQQLYISLGILIEKEIPLLK